MSFQMLKSIRVAALAGSALFLLAAGSAPAANLTADPAAVTDSPHYADGQPDFLADFLTTPATAPDIGPVLPEADSLRTLVDEVIADGQLADGNFTRGADLHCLATAVYFEAKSEPLAGQLAVAQVIMNRATAGGRFGADICGVVTAPSQFSFVRNGRLPEASNRQQWTTARAIAWIALSQGWKQIVPAATHFHAVHVKPAWGKLQRLATVGNHVFYQ